MTLSDKQAIFARNISKLILWAWDEGIKVTLGEADRPKSMQILYFTGYRVELDGLTPVLVKDKVRTKTMKSDHLMRMAHDLNIFVDTDGDGDMEYTVAKEHTQKLGDKWKSMHPDNYWGGDWGWDTPHFGMHH